VFQGSGDRHFRAHRADTGEALRSFETQTGVIATPISYAIDGEQYVSVLAGWGGAFGLMSGVPQPPAAPNGRLLTFKLAGDERLPAIPAPAPVPDPPPRMDVPDAVIEQGAALYGKYCGFCHGTGMVSGGTVPDLRRLPPEFHANFDAIVRLGAVEALGMPGFGDVLDAADVEALHAFVIEKSHEDKVIRDAPGWWIAIKRFVYRIVTWILMLFIEPSTHTA